MSAPGYFAPSVLPPPDLSEIRRYARCPQGADAPLSDCLAELSGLSGRVCYREFPIKSTPEGLDLGFAITSSKDLAKALSGCEKIVLFAATVGFLPDRLIRKYERIAPVKALFVQAIGAERVEALCDSFCKELAKEYAAAGESLRPRFSPGYGDLPLALQKEVFAALDCERRLGITLGESLLMMPSKSVTAIIGICKNEEALG